MKSLTDYLHSNAIAQPDATALIHVRATGGVVTTSYASLDRLVRSFAATFRKEFPQAGLIPMLLGKSAQCVEAMLGASAAGNGFACLNRKLRGPQLAQIFEVVQPSLGLVDSQGLAALREAANCPAVRKAIWWMVSDGELSLAHNKVREDLRQSVRIESPDLLDCEAPPKSELESRDLISPGTCLFTSGSTGAPKGVLISQKDLLDRAVAEADCFGLTRDDALLSILPFSFDVGLNQLLAAIVSGCKVVLLDSWLPVDILRACAQHSVTGISAVPAIWQDMMAAGVKFDTSGAHKSLRYITVSGGDMTAAQLERLPDLVPGAGIFKTYGQTETFRATCLRPEEFADRKRSVGRPFATARVYVVRDDNSPCAPNEEGEIVQTGLGLMSGYLGGHDPQHKLRPNPFISESDPSPTAVFTGDFGYLDQEKYLYVIGRRDGMVKVSGNRVYPSEILEQLMALPSVSAGEVIGIKSADGATRIVAFAVLAPGSEASSDQIRRQLMSTLPSFMVPHEVVLVAELPRTATGKVDRPGLLELVKSQASLGTVAAAGNRTQ